MLYYSQLYLKVWKRAPSLCGPFPFGAGFYRCNVPYRTLNMHRTVVLHSVIQLAHRDVCTTHTVFSWGRSHLLSFLLLYPVGFLPAKAIPAALITCHDDSAFTPVLRNTPLSASSKGLLCLLSCSFRPPVKQFWKSVPFSLMPYSSSPNERSVFVSPEKGERLLRGFKIHQSD